MTGLAPACAFPRQEARPPVLRVDRPGVRRDPGDLVAVRDFPWFRACGVGDARVHRGGVIDRTTGEPISSIRVPLTGEGSPKRA